MRNKVIHALRRLAFEPAIVLDVGANIGQSVAEFREAYPMARIHAFEPIRASFVQLQAATEADPLTTAYNVALSRAEATLTMTSRGASTGNKIVAQAMGPLLEEVAAETGDGFCARHGITRIDFLKIDTEGHDLDVLMGMHRMLTAGAVRFVQAECGLAPSNVRHVGYERLAAIMGAFGYGLFGLFGLTPLRGTANLSAHYSDAVFVRDDWQAV